MSETPLVYIVTWIDAEGLQHTREVPAGKETAHELVLMLRAQGYRAGWDEIDPLKGDTSEGV